MSIKKTKQGQIEKLTTGDIYLVGGHVGLGQLLEMSETFLETLEARFPHLWLPAEEALLEAENNTPEKAPPSHYPDDLF